MRALASFVVLSAVLISGCNRYEYFSLAGYEQASFQNEADILFIVDNSASMYDEASSLGLNFNAFVQRLVDPQEGTGVSTEGLGDAVDNYVLYTTQRGRFIDYQLSITTTSADPRDDADGDGDVIEAGEVGTLTSVPAVINEEDTEDVAAAFTESILCDTTCWPGECTGSQTDNCIPYDPYYECGDDPGGQVSWDYLDCICGAGWQPKECGSGNEEGLESALLALCRAAEDPPAACFDHTGSPFTQADVGTNAGFIRPESNIIVVIVTDEGDNSRLMAQGEDDPTPYLDLFEEFDNDITFAVVGPNYDPEDHSFDCNSGGGTSWGTRRYQLAAEATGGFFSSIEACTAPGGSCTGDNASYCEASDFSVHLQDLGDLLNSLLNQFPLQSIPDPGTIIVYVDDVQVEQSPCVENCEIDSEGEPIYGDGWTYETGENSVYFHGTKVPDYNADVRIYYRPVSDLPRSLPF
ncbi:MAG: hypothetical protein ABIO70_23110 [Pseudomonadota bacterium]